MKNLLLYNWNFMRYLRVALALFLFYQAYETSEWFYSAFGVFFLVQAIFNMGCSNGNCAVPNQKK